MDHLAYMQRSPIMALFETNAYQDFGEGQYFLKSDAFSSKPDCSLVDLTNLSRVGFRGKDAHTYLQQHGFVLPERANTAVKQDHGEWVLRLSNLEYCILGSPHDYGHTLKELEKNWVLTEQENYLLPRQDSHVWFQLNGVRITDVMAKLCGVDLSASAFILGQIAQTSVARVNAIVTNTGTAQHEKLDILCDRAAAVYFWKALHDAMAEFDGQIVGFNTLV